MKIDLKFSEQKKLLAYNGHKYTLSEKTRLQARVCPKQGFYDITDTKYGWICQNHVSREPHVAGNGFVAQIKRKINILIDFEISHLKNQSLCIN